MGLLKVWVSSCNRNANRSPLDASLHLYFNFVPGIRVGNWWESRVACSHDGVHRPTVAGIHHGPEGAYSVALSGGYPDDTDNGDSFSYTGEGGRDLKASWISIFFPVSLYPTLV